jgi:hypothetical protein
MLFEVALGFFKGASKLNVLLFIITYSDWGGQEVKDGGETEVKGGRGGRVGEEMVGCKCDTSKADMKQAQAKASPRYGIDGYAKRINTEGWMSAAIWLLTVSYESW